MRATLTAIASFFILTSIPTGAGSRLYHDIPRSDVSPDHRLSQVRPVTLSHQDRSLLVRPDSSTISLRWAILFVLSALSSLILELLHLPAALLLGSMIAAIATATTIGLT